jgi:hypothetical protein
MMRFNHAPYISEIQDQFSPEHTVIRTQSQPIWVRETISGIMEISGYKDSHEVVHVKSVHKVIQSYVLRSVSDYAIKAMAIVTSGAGLEVKVNEWTVSTIDAHTDFAIQLSKSKLYSHVRDENEVEYSIANIGGGYVLTKIEFLTKEQRRSEAIELYLQQAPRRAELEKRETVRQKAEEEEYRFLQKEKEEFLAKARYSLTTEDIQQLLPISPAHTFYADGYKATKVLQVYTLINQDMQLFICAVVGQRCTWLNYNTVGCRNYCFTPKPYDITNEFTAVHEQSKLGVELLNKQNIGEIIKIGQKPLLIVNIIQSGIGKCKILNGGYQFR